MGVNKQFKRTLISAAITLGFAAGTATATDWIMVQGTEPKNAAVPAKPFGFIQVKYEEDSSTPNTSNQFVPPKLLGPNVNSQSGFNVFHAQVGLRGIAFPLDDRINYFVMIEAGNTALSQNGPVMTDASITASYIKGARVRMGTFKQPGSEEAMQSTVKTHYMNFSETANQLLLERFPNVGGYTASIAPQTLDSLQTGATMNAYTKPVSGFRDTGVQVFDNFELANDWSVTYAVMVGQGSGIEQQNLDGQYDKYYYLATQNAGDGRMGGLKVYAWSQSGKRRLDITNDSNVNPLLYKRDRSGFGAFYDAKPYRVSFEYVTAEGMIFQGPDKPSLTLTASSANGNGATAKADGMYLEGAWYVPKTNWELSARYEEMNRDKGLRDEVKFITTTLGVKYNFNPKSHFMMNYAMRDFSCQGNGPAAVCNGINGNLSGVGDRYGVQLTTAL